MMVDPTDANIVPKNGRPEVSAAIGFVLRSARKPCVEISYQSKTMARAVALATQYARSSAAVLLVGESGTGKELFSRLIHKKSPRSERAFVAINCAAIPEQLMESEIFGHERGAFTGASQKRTGYFQQAHKGTLLLDEVSEIPVGLQAKLLRVIEENEVQPVGSDFPKPIDVRIIATSNRNLLKEVEAGRFRRDLYHRLNVLELALPSLRNRKADIPLLTTRFVEMFQHESRDGIVHVSKEAMEQLCRYTWPGNVRELRNVIHRACVVAENREIVPQTIPSRNLEDGNLDKMNWADMPLADVERQLIVGCLEKFNGNKKSAAEVLGVTPRTLSNKLKQYRAADFPTS